MRIRILWLLPSVLLVAGCGSDGGSASPTTPAPAANVAGSYNMQFNVSASCAASLPANARSRSYGTVTVTQSGTNLTITVGTSVGTLPTMLGTLIGSRAEGRFEMIDTAGGQRFQVVGQLFVSVGGNSLGSGTLNGAFFLDAANCTAADHRLTFSRR